MSADRHDTIPDFSSIAPSIWEYVPEPLFPSFTEKEDWSFSTLGSPDLILLFSWTGAQGRHVAKYTKYYQELMSSSTIMVVTTSAKDILFRSSERKQDRLQPAIDRILSYGSLSNVLIHCFSEGGSNKAVELADAYLARTGRQLPCSALCLDSTPGHPRLRRLCNAIERSLPPNPVLRSSGLAIGIVVIGGIWVVCRLFKGMDNNVISKTRRRLLDERLWDLTKPRCYLYSQKDALIAWQDVHEHATETRQSGGSVIEVRFENSEHCKHVSEDATAYWAAVVETWKQGLMQQKSKYGGEKEGKFDSAMGSDCSSETTLCL